MKQVSTYQDLKGRELALDDVPVDERKLISDLRSAAKKAKDWSFGDIFAKKVETESLCIKDSAGANVCVNGDQLRAFLNQSGQSTTPSSVPGGGVAAAPTPTTDTPPTTPTVAPDADTTPIVDTPPAADPEVTP